MWEVIGYESAKNEEGLVKSYTLYAKKPVTTQDGDGCMCKRFWYSVSVCSYVPAVGDSVFIATEVRGLPGKQYECVADIVRI